jgi:Flp pilus assembly protein TadD
LENYPAAISDCTQAIRLNAKDETAYKYRGAVYEKLGQNAKAIADYRQMLALDPTNEEARNRLIRLGVKPDGG